jgi:hypothetical protein
VAPTWATNQTAHKKKKITVGKLDDVMMRRMQVEKKGGVGA